MNICTATDLIQFASCHFFDNTLVSSNHSFYWSGFDRPPPVNFIPICTSLDNPRWSSISSGKKRVSRCRKAAAKDDGREGRPVQCEVEVISWRERRIKAELLVNADVKSVWNALTDYERLADFVPNLVSSGRIPCPYPGRIWLEQRGLQRALYWHIEARVVLDLHELKISEKHMELNFCMVEGDFKKFEGKWSVKSGTRPSTTTLSYEVNVIPTFNFPAIFLERIIRSDLPVNFLALACRSEINFHGNGLVADSPSDTTFTALVNSVSVDNNGTALEKKLLSAGIEVKEKYVKSTFGSLSPSASDLSVNLGVFGKFCKPDRPCIVDEVHLRRFDGLLENGGVHRGVVASITVKAPIREVWITLTDYEKLPDTGLSLI